MRLFHWVTFLLPDPLKYPPLPLSSSLIAFARFLSLFRVFVVGLMVLMMVLGIGSFGLIYPQLFLGLAIIYMVFATVIVLMRRQDTLQANEQLAYSLLDITFLTVLAGLSGGMQSGAAILILLVMGLGAGLCSKTGWKLLVLWTITATIANEIIRIEGLAGHLTFIRSQSLPIFRLFSGAGELNVSEAYMPSFFMGIAFVFTGWMANRLGFRLRQNDHEQELKQARLDLQLRINAVMMKSMDEGILLVDRKGQIHQINRKAQSLLSLATPNLIPNLRELSLRLFDHFTQWRKQKGLSECEFRISQNHHLHFARFLAVPPDGRMSIIFVQDKEQVRAQAQKLKLASLGLLTANIAHEIRNPLSAIHQSAEILQDELTHPKKNQPTSVAALSEASMGSLVDIILEHSERIDRIINDVSELGRRDRVQKGTHRLIDLLQQTTEQFISLHSEEINLANPHLLIKQDLDNHLWVEVDTNHFRQIWINLLNNAWHFCSKGEGAIRIHTQYDGNEVRLYIADDGAGIAPEHSNKIFEPFFSHRSGGTGLGLYLSKELAEANDGVLVFLGNAPGAYFCLHLHGQKR